MHDRSRRPATITAPWAALALACLALRAGPVLAAPATLDPDAAFGRPVFDEPFQRLDAGEDQTRPAKPHRWRTVFGNGGAAAPSNRTLGQAYFDSSALSLSPRGLVITATRKPSPFGKSWTSGLLTTKFSFSQPWGYFEAAMDIPVCDRGAWPAFWLIPITGTWPMGGEVDAPEAVGKGKLFWSLHSGANGKKVSDTTPWTPPGDPCVRGVHRYGALVARDTTSFYYDRHLVLSKPTPSDFGQQPFYMLIDLAMGGGWPGPPSPDLNQMQMLVTRVEAWAPRAGRQP